MEISDKLKQEFVRRLITARTRLLCSHGFYGLLIMHASFALDENIVTAATDGDKIFFSPEFLSKITDGELDFVLMHEILHMALQHVYRQGGRDHELFNIACDIVVNSNILHEVGGDLKKISIDGIGALMHVAPDGKEGFEHTAEEVYEMLAAAEKARRRRKGITTDRVSDVGDPDDPDGGDESGDGNDGDVDDADGSKDKNRSAGKRSKSNNVKGNGGSGASGAKRRLWRGGAQGQFDDHSMWRDGDGSDDELENADKWARRIVNAAEAVTIRERSYDVGNIPLFAKRILKEMQGGQVDWRTVLNDFVQEEITDYSFSPPDRRYDGPFFLPDFNGVDYVPGNLLFMIDTSGSMSDDMISNVFSEVRSAVEQFDGKLDGKLGFFDAAVVPPQPFSDVTDLKKIAPRGGGGTNFHAIFKYVDKYMSDDLPRSIIILTDGIADYPQPSAAHDVPVLWILCDNDKDAPWGKTVHITA